MIMLVPVGAIEESLLEFTRSGLSEVFGETVKVGGGIPLLGEALNPRRGQYLASMIIDKLPAPPGPGDKVLGIVDIDLFAPGLNFVFGEADMAGRRAIISLPRLRQQLYGLPADENLFRERMLKEAVHELGHTYGLGHCLDVHCVMHFSNRLLDTDIKGWRFCPRCRIRLGQAK